MSAKSSNSRFIRWWNRHVADAFRNLRRQLRRAVSSPGLALKYQGFRRAIERRDWRDAHRRLAPIAVEAELAGDARLLMEMAFAAERLGEHEKSNEWAAANARLTGGVASTDWRGESLADATLVVRFMEGEKQGMAIGLNMAGYVAEAAAGA